MKEWFSGRELAGLPGMPSTERRVRSRATSAEWQARERSGRGGGREYYIGSLPDETRVALLMRERRATTPDAAPAATTSSASARDAELWETYQRKNDKAKAEANRRVHAVHAVEQLVRDGCQRLEAYTLVATELGESESTIRNWLRKVKGQPEHLWTPLLLPNWTGRQKTAEYDDRIYWWFRDAYLVAERPAATTIYRRVVRLAAANGLTMPSYATLVRELRRREDPALVVLEREGERAAAELFPYVERSVASLYACEVVNADGHILDLSVRWEDGEVVRPVLLTIQDVHSRAIVGWKLLKSESAYGMSLAFLEAFDRVGLPKRIYVDNTLAAASKRMTAGAVGRKRFRDREGDPIGVLPLLGVELHFTTPAHGQAKPIERLFNTLSGLVSKDARFSGAYLGNNPLNKPHNYGTNTVAIADVEAVVRSEVAVYNTEQGRRGGVANGASYQDVFTASYAAHAHEIVRLAAHQRHLLYLVADRVTVDRKHGHVRVYGNRYWSEELARLRGTQVVVRYHPTESLHTSVWVYRLDGTLVCEAPIVQKAGFETADRGQAHARAKRQYLKKKKDLRHARRRLDAAEIAAMVPPVDGPDIAAVVATASAASARRVDFTLPTTPEQLGEKAADRRAASERVNAAISKLGLIEPKRKRA